MRIKLDKAKMREAERDPNANKAALCLAQRMLKPSRLTRVGDDWSFEASNETAKELIEAGLASEVVSEEVEAKA